MATLSATNPTLLDLAKRLGPGGSTIDSIVEILNEENGILEDMTFVEANGGHGHKTTIRSGLPSATWRKLYGGVQPSKSTTVQVTDSVGMLEAYAEADAALVDMSPDPAGFRLSEDRAFLAGMSKEMAQTVFYGSETTAPEEFTGLAARYASLSAASGDNIVNAAGAGADNTSIYLVVWSPNTVHGIYAKGGQLGFKITDKGQQTVSLSDGSMFEAYRTHYKWDMGLSVRDWRYAARIANIDVSDLNTVANTENLVKWMIEASEKIPNLGAGRAVFYCNRNIRTKLRLGILEKVASNLAFETVAGKRVMVFDDIPVVRCDAILNTESVVS